MKKILILSVFFLAALHLRAQVFPFDFTPVTPGNDDMFIPFQTKTGATYNNRKVTFPVAKRYFAPIVAPTLIAYTPSATGNALNLMEFVKHTTTGLVWYIDATGRSILVNDPTIVGRVDSVAVIQDSIIVSYNYAGAELRRDTIAVAGGGTITGTGAAGRVSFWNGTTSLFSASDFLWTGTQLALPVGAAALPSLTTPGDGNTGLFWTGSDVLGFTRNGIEGGRFDVNGFQFVGDFRPNSAAGTAGEVLRSAGPGNPPTWGSVSVAAGGTGLTAIGTALQVLRVNAGGTALEYAAASGGISGLTTNYVTKATSATAIGNSQIFDNGTDVGIGTITPAAKLDVNGVKTIASYTNVSIITTGGLYLRNGIRVTGSEEIEWAFAQLDSAGNNRVLLGLSDSPSPDLYINMPGTASTHFISGGNIASKRVVVTNNGSIGAGTTSPSAKIESVSTSAQMRLSRNTSIYTDFLSNSNGHMEVRPTGGRLHLYADDTQSAVFVAGATGTGAATLALDASDGSLSTTNYMSVRHNNDLTGNIFTHSSAGNLTLWAGSSSITNQLVLSTSGNLGIGNATASEKLQVTGNILASGNNTAARQVAGDGTAAAPGISFTNDLDLGFHRPTTNVLGIATAGLERMRVDATGRVGIGNTSPSALLTLGTAGTTAGTLSFAGSTSGTVTMQPAAAAGAWTLTLPTTAGTNFQVLQTNGSGVTTWVTPTQDTQYIYIVAVPAGTAVTQTAGTLFQSAVALIPEHLDGYTVRRADYALLNNTSSTGDLFIGIRRQSTTNTTVSSNNMAGTFTGSAVRASSTSTLAVSKNQWLRVEVHPSVAGTLDGTIEGLICTLMLTK